MLHAVCCPRYQQIPDDHLARCRIYPEADSPRRTELRPDGAGLPDTDFLLYLHLGATDKCRAEVGSHWSLKHNWEVNRKYIVKALLRRETDKVLQWNTPQPNVLAYAVHCQTDAHGRPVAGVVVICRDRLTRAAYSHQTSVQVPSSISISSCEFF